MENVASGFPDDWSQELDDLIDVTVEDMDAQEAADRMEKAIKDGLPGSQSQLDFEKALSLPKPNRLMSPEFEKAQDLLKQIDES